ncbi:MAG: GNAT family N-acetyltransferase [Bacteroidales bacterium]
MPAEFMLRDYRDGDAGAVNALALAAFAQYQTDYDDWPGFAGKIAAMSALSASAELIVAARGDRLVGAVAYVAPRAAKAAFFDPAWAVVRMLVVAPDCRGMGIGRALALACESRARRDGAAIMALHTSPIMEVALGMYLRMGFAELGAVAPIHGVPYGVYTKSLP